MKTKSVIILIMSTSILTLLIVMFKQANNAINKNDLMNVFTIGWNNGYQEGIKYVMYNKNPRSSKGEFSNDSIFMEFHLSHVK